MLSNRNPDAHSLGSGPNIESFLARLDKRRGSEIASVALKIIEWATSQGIELQRNDKKDGYLFLAFGHVREGSKLIDVRPIDMTTIGNVEVGYNALRRLSSFSNDSDREKLLSRLRAIPRLELVEEPENWAWFRLSCLTTDATIEQFLAVLDWLNAEVMSSRS